MADGGLSAGAISLAELGVTDAPVTRANLAAALSFFAEKMRDLPSALPRCSSWFAKRTRWHALSGFSGLNAGEEGTL